MEIEKNIKESIKTIIQSNAITAGRQDLSACEMDIFFIILSKIGTQSAKSIFRIYSTDIELITGRKWNQKQLRNATNQLGEKKIEIKSKIDYTRIWMFQSVHSFFGKGYFEVLLSEPIIPYLEDLKNNFTVMGLKAALAISSKYSKRIYSIACQWRNARAGQKHFQLEEFREMLGLKDPNNLKEELHERISDLKVYVLDIAMKQINEHTDIKIEYKLIKQGRSFTGIDFLIEEKKLPLQNQIDFNKDLEYQKNVSTIEQYGLDRESAEIIALKHYEDFSSTVDEVNEKIRQGKITITGGSPVAYIKGVFQKKGVLKTKKAAK